jgi:nickel transport protein
MRRSYPGSLSLALVVLAVALGASLPTPALAHKTVVFATCTGETIEGEVYFQGGAAARNVEVTLVGPDGQQLGRTQTDDEGKFTFPVRFRCDHKVIADAGSGHGAEYTVAADELPESLPPPGGGDEAGPPVASAQQGAPDRPPEQSVADPEAKETEAGSQELRAIARQLEALRREMNQYHNQLRLRDVLGGLGYILGIMGVVFYFLGVRRKEKRPAGTDSPTGS